MINIARDGYFMKVAGQDNDIYGISKKDFDTTYILADNMNESRRRYSRRYVCEAIAYWKKQLSLNETARNFDASATSVLPEKTEKNMNRIKGHIYSFIKQIAEDYPDEFDVSYY